MKTKQFIKVLTLFLFVGTSMSNAQELDVNFELRPRFEYRNGYKELMKDTEYPTSFISQRSRLDFGYTQDKLKAKVRFQNVSVWGDVATTAKADNNGIRLFETWVSYQFNDKWSGKIGRQVLSYDNQRILGEIGWAQQAQSHDALLFSYKKSKSQLDLGLALNNSNENVYETAYNTTYKNMQFAWFHHNFTNFGLSVLALNNGYQFEDSNDGNFKVAYMQTFGTYGKWGSGKKFYGDAAIYAQTGEISLGVDKTNVAAYYGALNLGYQVSSKFNFDLGFEYLSGTDQDETSTTVKSFTPLFGTNHAFNGFMDYFYVGNHKYSVGLQDYYIKLGYKKDKWKFNLIPHIFMSNGTIINPVNFEKEDDYLGTEVDFTLGYTYDKNITISGGYSQMFGSSSLELLKGGSRDTINNWAWVMISIHPKFL